MDNSSKSPFLLNNALKAFEPFIGSWETTGKHGMISNKILHGKTIFEWHESKAFVRISSYITEDVGIPRSVAMIGSDGTSEACMMIYYDERGVSRHYQVIVEGDVMRWWRDAPDLSQRYSLTMHNDRQNITGKGEISVNGSSWEQDLDLMYTRIK